MKITQLRVVHTPLKLHTPFKTALRTAHEIDNIEVYLDTDVGLCGRGATAPTLVITGDSKEGIMGALLGPIQAALLGKDPRQRNTLANAIQQSCVGNTSAKAAADIALYDLFAKWLGQPLYAVLGGHKPLTTNMTIGLDTPDIMQKAAQKAVADGFDTLKIKVGNAPQRDIERMQAIVAAVPATTRLRLDANQGWTAKDAVRVIRQLEALDLNIDWVEQPVTARDFAGLKYVTDNVATKIMADESVFSPQDAFALISDRCVDLLNIKLLKCGGIAQAQKIADLAAIHHMPCMIGSMMESSVSVSAAAHLAASHPNILYCDFDAPLWLSEAPQGLRYEGQQLFLSDGPGLGLDA
ncbi:MAG: dipeptide epimerase [Neisseriaceae bacterium]|nr:dipeptide epimerase [Neisseriaceae bacterium]